MLKNYSWPGNIRELIQALERTVASAQYEDILFPNHLPTRIRVEVARKTVSNGDNADSSPDFEAMELETMPSLKEIRDRAIARIEKKYLTQLMIKTDSDVSRACKISGLSRSRLYTLLKKNDVSTKL